MPYLETPHIDYMPSYIDALREGMAMGIGQAKSEEDIAKIENDPQGYIDEYLRVKDEPVVLPDGSLAERVAQTKLWYMDGKKFLGKVSIRHNLNENLLLMGGHIGYGVRPSEQGKGYASDILKQALDFCREQLGMNRVLLTVGVDNQPSIKVIEKNGGVLENITDRPYDDTIVRRYWIYL